MHECHAHDAFINARTGRVGSTYGQIVTPDEYHIGVFDIEVNPFTGDDPNGSKRPDPHPFQYLFGGEHRRLSEFLIPGIVAEERGPFQAVENQAPPG